MIRFIVLKKQGSEDHPNKNHYQTIDADVPELEQKLLAGGYSQHAYEQYELVGVEILPPKPEGGDE